MNSQHHDEDAVFDVARKIADAGAREMYLAQIYGSDDAMIARVQTLLRAHDESGFLEAPPGGAELTIDQPIAEHPGSEIDRYKLLEQIGEGGMGVVYMAEQQRPVRRKVALKIIKPGMDTKQVVARFEVERQALAMMDHPNIARVFDAGSTESGRPYFVMELVRGISITEYCDKNKLETRERLRMFILVCQAVQHAHTKGIIHRDLKPSNVLVTLHDGVPVPKIIDFGVAKATGQQLTERTLFTNFAQMVGTPLYMSPEQAEMSGLDVDTRSDIYSLGVLLYELLAGDTPFDRKRLRKAAYDEVRRIIREEEPDKPSTRLSSLGEASVTVSAQRSTDPAKLKQLLRGELDWIVMKALEKDRTRRYDTASALVVEVKRYLNGEPVEACPPSTTYRLRKFARRHQTQVAVAAGFLALLMASSVVAWALFVDARRAEFEAVAATADADEARQHAVDAMDEIQAQRDRAEANFQRAQQQEQKITRLANDRQRRLYDYNLIKANIAFQQDEELKTAQLLADCLEEQRGWEWHRLNRLTAAQRNLKLAGPSILFGDTSPTESRVAVVDNEGNLRLCDLADGRTIWSGRTAVKGFPITMFSPAGDLIAVYSDPFGGGSGRLEVWDATGQMLWTASRDQDRIGLVSFSPDGSYLAFSTFGPGRASLALHHPRDPTPVWQQPTPGLALMAFDQAAKKLFMTLATSPDLAAETKLCCWSVEEPSEIWSVRRSTASLPCLTPDGFLLTGGKDHTLEIRDPASGTLVEELASSAPDTAFDVRCSPDGRHIISAGDTGHIVLWDWKSRSEKLSIKRPVGRGLRAAFTHDSDYFVVVRPADSTVELRSVDPAPAEIVLSGHEQAVKGVAFSLDGKEVVSTSFDGTLRKWNTTSGQEVRTKAVDASPAAMAYSPRGTHIATGGRKVLSLWNSETGELVHQWPDAGRVRCLEFSPDGKRLIAGASDKGLKLFDVETGHKILSKETPQGIRGVAFCADGRRAVSLVSQTGQIDLWDVESNSGPQSLRPAGTGDIGLALIGIPRSAEPQPRNDNLPPPNLVAAGINNTIELWDIDAGQKLNTLRGHDDKINCLTPNHDGSRLFSGDRSGVVKVWNLDTGEQLLTMQAHESHEVPGWEKRGVFSLALSPDGKTLATAGADKLIKLWETTHPSKRHAQQRRIVEQATRVVDQLDEQSGALRDVLESLTKDKSLDEQVLSVALDIAHARGQFIDAIRQSLKENIESSAGGDLGIADSTRISKWHNQASDIANATSSLPLPKLVSLLTPLVESSPSSHEFVYVRGLANARMGRWQDAVADLSKALGLVPEKTALWHEYAYRQSFLLAYIGESERYGRLCQQVLADFSDTTDAYLAERTVKMCLFSKDIRVDLQQAGELADRAYTTGTTLEWLEPYLVLSKGIADFRRNDLDSAIPILETVAERFRQSTWADPTPSYLAMAYTRAGLPDKAQLALEAADRVIGRLPTPDADEFPAWNDWMVVQIVRREAEEAVKQQAQ